MTVDLQQGAFALAGVVLVLAGIVVLFHFVFEERRAWILLGAIALAAIGIYLLVLVAYP